MLALFDSNQVAVRSRTNEGPWCDWYTLEDARRSGSLPPEYELAMRAIALVPAAATPGEGFTATAMLAIVIEREGAPDGTSGRMEIEYQIEASKVLAHVG